MLKNNYRVFVFPDLHFPNHDIKTIKNVFKYIKDSKPFDEFIQLGDFMDFDYCSRWTKGNYRKLENKRFTEDYKRANLFLDELLAVLHKNNPKMKIVFLEGNHDKRPEDYIDAHPDLEGLLEVENCLNYKERGIEYHKYWNNSKTYKLGHAEFMHGQKISKYHSYQMALAYMGPIFYGHTHDVTSFTLEDRDKTKLYLGQSLGTLSLYNPEYMGDKPSKWQQAFTEFVFSKDGMFNYNITRIFNHGFIHLSGKKY